MNEPDELLEKVKKSILTTGYPLELEIGSVFEDNGWIPFHSVEYEDPETEKQRELDLLVYKLVKKRRLELRVSTKTSLNKQFVFFTRQRRSFPSLSDLKYTPVSERPINSIPGSLGRLPIFSHPRDCINFTVLSGNKVDREARSLLKDAMMSSVNSIHHRILPQGLLADQRGTLYFFLVVLRGHLFEVSFDHKANALNVDRCQYARWHGRLSIPKKYWQLSIPNEDGKPVPFQNVLHWFGDWITVEFISDHYLTQYLGNLERVFEMLDEEELSVFGKGWSIENFPKIVGLPPSIVPNNNTKKS
jgi:hypothetical protein